MKARLKNFLWFVLSLAMFESLEAPGVCLPRSWKRWFLGESA